MNKNIQIYCFVSLAVTLFGAAVPASAKDAGGTNVGACHVTGGANAGKSGTYTIDVDGINCAGSWGSTSCGSGKCKIGALTTGTKPPIVTGLKPTNSAVRKAGSDPLPEKQPIIQPTTVRASPPLQPASPKVGITPVGTAKLSH
jgi:hypothetical protein